MYIYFEKFSKVVVTVPIGSAIQRQRAFLIYSYETTNMATGGPDVVIYLMSV